jgi:hypothetical protein
MYAELEEVKQIIFDDAEVGVMVAYKPVEPYDVDVVVVSPVTVALTT